MTENMADSVRTKAIVFGATGLVGRNILRQACESGRYDLVVAIVRNELDADLLSEMIPDMTARLRLRQIRCSPADLADPDIISQIFQTTPDGKVVHVYCALGTTMKAAGSKEAFRRVDHDFVVAAARFARNIGAQRFIWVSSIGADEKSRTSFYLKVKGETESDIAKLTDRKSSLRAIAVRPSLLLGEREETRVAEGVGQLLGRVIKPALVGPAKHYKPIAASEVAAAMIELAFDEFSHPFLAFERVSTKPEELSPA